LLGFADREWRRIWRASETPAQAGDNGGQERKDHHGDDYIMDALTDIGNERGQEVASQDGAAAPDAAADNVIDEIARIAHRRRAGHRRAEGTHDGHEAGEDDGFAAVRFVELVRTFEMAPLEKERVLAAVERQASLSPDPIANLVAGNRAERGQWQQRSDIQDMRGSEDSGRDQKGIAGKKEAEEKAGLDKHDGTDQKSPAPLNQALDVVWNRT
jgi:hypothetical protein